MGASARTDRQANVRAQSPSNHFMMSSLSNMDVTNNWQLKGSVVRAQVAAQQTLIRGSTHLTHLNHLANTARTHELITRALLRPILQRPENPKRLEQLTQEVD